jgi:hypothetical protein
MRTAYGTVARPQLARRIAAEPGRRDEPYSPYGAGAEEDSRRETPARCGRSR